MTGMEANSIRLISKYQGKGHVIPRRKSGEAEEKEERRRALALFGLSDER